VRIARTIIVGFDVVNLVEDPDLGMFNKIHYDSYFSVGP